MRIKIHESYRKVVALCDSDLVGKKFEEGKMQLDVRENFYGGEEVGEVESVEMLKSLALDDAIFNIVGACAVEAAMKAGIINEDSMGKIQGVPFALVLL
ncbi:MAG: DUF424 family protein [Nanoarchaeota archaeon]|nr:DUF424 family protein [Nanoarchaeota archaeon]MBU1102965.1 DUF424 family protein [Nanoarchaeota archaeon]